MWTVRIYILLGFGGCREGLRLTVPQLDVSIRLVYTFVHTRGDSVEVLLLEPRPRAWHRDTRQNGAPSIPEVVGHLDKVWLNKLQRSFHIMQGVVCR